MPITRKAPPTVGSGASSGPAHSGITAMVTISERKIITNAATDTMERAATTLGGE